MATKDQRRVVIVDDSRTIQAILDNAFSNRSDFRVVGFAADASTAGEVIRRLMPDVVTIDLCMPYLDGEALLEMIKDLRHVCKVVVSDKCVSNKFLSDRLIQSGASLCLGKSQLVADPVGFFKLINKAADKTDHDKRCLLHHHGRPAYKPAKQDIRLFQNLLAGFPKPADEQQRIELGRSKGLFNAGHEVQFDTITRNAAKLTAFPISLLTFIDRDTQWVKSVYGLDIESTPREQAFCNYTICQGGAFVVANANTDERFAGNPLVTGSPHIRTYTGYPVTTGEGVTIGALCVIDTRVRTVSKHALDQLAGMAEIVAGMIDVRPRLAA